jgi:hypothetical protein
MSAIPMAQVNIISISSQLKFWYLMFCLAAIAAAQYAHLKHFPYIEA